MKTIKGFMNQMRQSKLDLSQNPKLNIRIQNKENNCLCRFLILFDILYIKVSLKQEKPLEKP